MALPEQVSVFERGMEPEIATKSTVFIVSDDPISVEPLCILLDENLGVDAVSYDRVELFLDEFDPSCPGCLMLDVTEAETSQLGVLEQFAERMALPPMVFVTGDDLGPRLIKALRVAAVGVFTRPADPERLVKSLREALELDRARRGIPRF
jgi:two-component system, LuxR family, response regulator FixJ